VLELVETFVSQTKRIKSRQDAEAVLQQMVEAFGFRAAVMIEYSPDLSKVVDYLDSDPERRPRWPGVFNAEGVRRSVKSTQRLVEQGRVASFDDTHFDPHKPLLEMVRSLDLTHGISVPISYGTGVAGVINFSGQPELSDNAAESLHIISYLLFATARSNRGATETARPAALTPREKEVMVKSSLGHTTPEIAQMLGLSDRTVNQHIENVSYKFGTKNRLHTVASLLRLNLLD